MIKCGFFQKKKKSGTFRIALVQVGHSADGTATDQLCLVFQ